MKIKLLCTFLLSTSVLPGIAMAADPAPNPLQSLFSALGNLAKPVAKPANDQMTNSNGVEALTEKPDASALNDAQILKLLKIQAGGNFVSPSSCDGLIDQYEKTIKSDLSRGDAYAASVSSELSAKIIATCAIERNDKDHDYGVLWTASPVSSNYSLASWAGLTGAKLALNLQVKKSSGTDIRNSIDQQSASRAKDLLVYAKVNGISGADGMLETLSKTIGTEAKASKVSTLSGSAESVCGKFNSNKFGFEQKYLGKTIEVSGKILHINGTGKYVNISLLGNSKLSNDERGYQHEIACIITKPESMSAAADLEGGKHVKVRGVFDHDTLHNSMATMQINLSDCEIVK